MRRGTKTQHYKNLEQHTPLCAMDCERGGRRSVKSEPYGTPFSRGESFGKVKFRMDEVLKTIREWINGNERSIQKVSSVRKH